MNEISEKKLDYLIESLSRGRDGRSNVSDDMRSAAKALIELRDRRAAGGEAVGFEDWWAKDGYFYDPDTSDVPWFDKRGGLADYAYAAGFKAAAARHPSNIGLSMTDDMVERAWKAQREYHQSREMSYERDGVRAALVAALEGE